MHYFDKFKATTSFRGVRATIVIRIAGTRTFVIGLVGARALGFSSYYTVRFVGYTFFDFMELFLGFEY